MIEVTAVPDNFSFDPQRTALVVIDMQRDFIEPGGFGAALGNDVTPLAAIIPAVQQLLALGRKAGLLVIHTRESHLPDCPTARPPSELVGRQECRLVMLGQWGEFWCAANPAIRFWKRLRRWQVSG